MRFAISREVAMQESDDWEGRPPFANRMKGMTASEIRELLKILDQPDVISFAGGIPDPALFPVSEIDRFSRRILGAADTARSALQYSVSEGFVPLRQWLALHMASLGVPCDVENIAITSGSQQALDFVGRLLLNPGDTALLMAPTYLGAFQAFSAFEPRYDRLDLSEGGPSGQFYAATARAAGGRAALAYVVPDFANPTGETLSEAQRLRLLDLAAEANIHVIEDAAYQALRFEGDAVPSCLALDIRQCGHIDRARVIYCGTFSKTLAPGLRTGWVCASREVIRKIILIKQAADLHCSTFNQMIIHGVAEALYPQHVGKLIAEYSMRRDAMVKALAAYMAGGVTRSAPQGGMFVWLTLPPFVDAGQLLSDVLRRERIAFVPGAAFYAGRSKTNNLRLSFALQPSPVIDNGIARIARVLHDYAGAAASMRKARGARRKVTASGI